MGLTITKHVSSDKLPGQRSEYDPFIALMDLSYKMVIHVGESSVCTFLNGATWYKQCTADFKGLS